MAETPAPHTPLRPVAAVLGSILVSLAVALIWALRLTVHRPMYVSELGAVGEPTARLFELALLLIVAGAGAIAWAARGIRSSAWVIGRWTPSLSLAVSAALFLVASQVPCTAGCPLPVGASFTGQDFTHTLAAVLAFAAAATAMLQAAFADGRRMLRRFSLVSALAVAVIAATGGILSLLRFATDIGGFLELVATTIGIGWAVVFGLAVARETSVARLAGGGRSVASLAVGPGA